MSFYNHLSNAIHGAQICSYAQGLAVIESASGAKNWDIVLAGCVQLWKGGCIIRAVLLNQIQAKNSANPKLPNLMTAPVIAKELKSVLASWRNVVITCANNGMKFRLRCKLRFIPLEYLFDRLFPNSIPFGPVDCCVWMILYHLYTPQTLSIPYWL